jgi:hypothetical protein
VALSHSGRRGLTGLDALILSIALLLVAAVVGAILLETTQELMKKDQTTQKEKQKSIQKPITVEAVRGRDYNDDNRIDAINFAVRLMDTADPISFNETSIIVNTKILNCTQLTFGLDADPNCEYNITYGKRGHDYTYGKLTSGDLVEVEYGGPGFIAGIDDTHAQFTFVPANGIPTALEMNIPDRIHPKNMQLWPLND